MITRSDSYRGEVTHEIPCESVNFPTLSLVVRAVTLGMSGQAVEGREWEVPVSALEGSSPSRRGALTKWWI